MKVVFTVCSNNYLSQAKTLGDSLIQHNPDYIFVIGLVDKKNSDIDYSFFAPYLIIPIEDIGIRNFDELWKKFNIIELNTSVKASFFKFLISLYPQATCIFYFDPDIMIYYGLGDLENELLLSDILITPHILTPISLDEFSPGENLFLNYGIYNLGFIGIKQSKIALNFLDWWEERTLAFGYDDTCNGLFVDQLWINLVPVFFKNVKVLNSFGYNAGPWNLHERRNINAGNGS